jgi:RNA polymerase sigma factor (sigma-70 family)
MTLSLGDVARLPLEDRATYVERFGHDEICSAVQALRTAASPCAVAATPARIAWAMAYNVCPEEPAGTRGVRISDRFLGTTSNRAVNRWSVATPWRDVWDFYVTPRRALVFPDDGERPWARTLLRELARSVACEQRSDPPWSIHPVDQMLAQECQREVYELSCARIRGVLARRSEWRDFRDDIVGDTWLNAIHSAWSPTAHRRFAGRSLISSWLCAIALNTARNHTRTRSRQHRHEEPWSSTHANSLVADGAGDAMTTTVREVELARRFRQCIENLDERQRELLNDLLHGATPMEIAHKRGTSPPTVSQHQDKLMRDLRRCFSERSVRPGTSKQKVFKAVRELLASLGPAVFPFLKKRPQDGPEP